MKKVILVVILAAAAYVAYAYFYEENPTDAVWLHGVWQLTYDPDGSDKDYMEFFPDGEVQLQSSPGKSGKACVYASKYGHITLTCVVKNQNRSMSLEVSSSNDRLTNSTGAYYSKM